MCSSDNLSRNIDRLETALNKTIKRIRADMVNLEEGLTSSQFYVLALLLKNKLTVTEIAKALNVKPSAVTSILDRMHENGFIVRRRDEADRRLVMVGITAKGQSIFATSQEKRHKIVGHYFSCLTDEEIELLVNVFEKVAHSIDTEHVK